MPRVAVIGTGASGYSATRALALEGHFDYIRVFERKPYVGGIWAYEPTPDPFLLPCDPANQPPVPPKSLSPATPVFTPSLPPRPNIGNASYATLDTNSGATTMAFTHTPFPLVNSADSIRTFGPGNETRPRRTVQGYIEKLFEPYLHLVQFRTHVENIEKIESINESPVTTPESSPGLGLLGDGHTPPPPTPKIKWRVTLRRESVPIGEKQIVKDHWYQEDFDAIVVATGHYTLPRLPSIDGLSDVLKTFTDALIHSKSYRDVEDFVGKRVVIVGSSVSSSDIVEALHDVVSGPLYVTQRSSKVWLANVFRLPNVQTKPIIRRLLVKDTGITVIFDDGTVANDIEKIIFATGFHADYKFLPWKDAVMPTNRLSGFYQHIFRIGDPTFTVVGQARAGVTLRVFEYQAICAARYLSGHSQPLPSIEEQERWEQDMITRRGDSEAFHTIKPDYQEYYSWMQAFMKPVHGREKYPVPEFEEWWVENDQSVMWEKTKVWEGMLIGERREEARREREERERERETEKRKRQGDPEAEVPVKRARITAA